MPPVKKKSAKGTSSDVKALVEKRNRLTELLTTAAQIEHDVMVQYLFAAFSLKKSVNEFGVTYAQLEKMRNWATPLMMVARQEMEHLGYVSNLLTAIGEAPILRRPAFPVPANKFPLNEPSSLTAFSVNTMTRFVCYEMPNEVLPDQAKYLSGFIKNFNPATYDGIYRLYMEIGDLMEQIDEKDLFIGPPSAQIITGGNSVLVRGRIYPEKSTGKPAPIYDTELLPITNLETAKAAIQQIVTEGEGASAASTNSHFGHFLAIHQELTEEIKRDPNFRPARNVGENPRLADGTSIPGVTYVTHPDTVGVMKVFDQAYATMLLMLMRYFANTDESQADLKGLQDTAFFPLMTVGIRPLAEILTQLPADLSGTVNAGPSFVIPKSVQLLPHRKSAWRVILGELQLLTTLAEEAAGNKALPVEIQGRLSLAYENFARMTMNFQDAMHARTL